MIKNPIPWPNGAKCACAISFDVDADSLIHVARPKDSYNRLYPITMGRYGPTVAIPRILRRVRLGLKQSFFIPAWTMERYPAAVEAVLEAGARDRSPWFHPRGPERKQRCRTALLVRKSFGRTHAT